MIKGLTIPEGLEGLMDAFRAEITQDGRRLIELIHSTSPDLASHAHAMRGKCALFGEEPLAELLGEIEFLAENRMRENMEDLLQQVVERARELGIYV